jgi:hypothetical protein
MGCTFHDDTVKLCSADVSYQGVDTGSHTKYELRRQGSRPTYVPSLSQNRSYQRPSVVGLEPSRGLIWALLRLTLRNSVPPICAPKVDIKQQYRSLCRPIQGRFFQDRQICKATRRLLGIHAQPLGTRARAQQQFDAGAIQPPHCLEMQRTSPVVLLKPNIRGALTCPAHRPIQVENRGSAFSDDSCYRNVSVNLPRNASYAAGIGITCHQNRGLTWRRPLSRTTLSPGSIDVQS